MKKLEITQMLTSMEKNRKIVYIYSETLPYNDLIIQ